MKTIALLVLSLVTFSSCGQSKLNNETLKENNNLFILLKNKKCITLNGFENNEIVEKRDFEISEKSIYTTDENQVVVIVDTAKNNLSFFDIKSDQETKLSIPFKIRPKAVLLNQNNIFIGGELEEEMLVQYNMKTNEWYSLEIPTAVLFPRKAIDDLLVNDTLLIAIDNLVMPKYILYYHLNTDEKLSLSHFEELKSNGTYESIYKGRLSTKYIGLLSATFSGYVGLTEHITVYKGLDLTTSFAISTNENDKDYHPFNDMLIIDDKVVIASKEKGLGIFEIKDSYFKKRKDEFDIFNARVESHKIKYKPYGNENIIHLTQIPGTKKVVLTIMNKSKKIRHEIIEI